MAPLPLTPPGRRAHHDRRMGLEQLTRTQRWIGAAITVAALVVASQLLDRLAG